MQLQQLSSNKIYMFLVQLNLLKNQLSDTLVNQYFFHQYFFPPVLFPSVLFSTSTSFNQYFFQPVLFFNDSVSHFDMFL